jgi:phospholipid/cholesterol/gamma-HCH transport system permease protein
MAARPPPSTQTPPVVTERVFPDGSRRVELAGAWNLRGLAADFETLAPRVRTLAADRGWNWDLTRIDVLDHAGAMVLWRAWGSTRAPGLVLRPEQEAIFKTLQASKDETPPDDRREWLWPLLALGALTLRFGRALGEMLVLFGQAVLDFIWAVRNPARAPWRELSASIYHTGTQALGITALVGFLIGVTLSYLSAHQLRQFGADVFIVNILGLSIIREIGPVLAAILVAGRSGSAMTAQLGVMRVTEELDAMSVMGIPHSQRLVMPKMVALAVSLPLIVLWTSAMALLGGMLAANYELGIGYRFFMSELPNAVPIANLWLGLAKGAVFGLLIALVACHYGMQIEPNTESLGLGTTSSVVTSITVVILADAVFAIVFSDIGLPG